MLQNCIPYKEQQCPKVLWFLLKKKCEGWPCKNDLQIVSCAQKKKKLFAKKVELAVTCHVSDVILMLLSSFFVVSIFQVQTLNQLS